MTLLFHMITEGKTIIGDNRSVNGSGRMKKELLNIDINRRHSAHAQSLNHRPLLVINL